MNPSSTPPRYPRFAGQPLRSLRSVGNEMKKTSGHRFPEAFPVIFIVPFQPAGTHRAAAQLAIISGRKKKRQFSICNGPQILPDTLAGVFQITFLFYPEIIKGDIPVRGIFVGGKFPRGRESWPPAHRSPSFSGTGYPAPAVSVPPRRPPRLPE